MKDESIDLENPLITEKRAQHGWVPMTDGVRVVPVKVDSATFNGFVLRGKKSPRRLKTFFGITPKVSANITLFEPFVAPKSICD